MNRRGVADMGVLTNACATVEWRHVAARRPRSRHVSSLDADAPHEDGSGDATADDRDPRGEHRDPRACGKPLAEERVWNGPKKRPDGDRACESTHVDRRRAGSVVQSRGGDARSEARSEERREPSLLEQRTDAPHPRAPGQDPRDCITCRDARDSEGDETSYHRTREGEDGAPDDAERHAARRREHGAGEHRRNEQDPCGQRDEGRKGTDVEQQCAYPRRRVREQHGGRDDKREDHDAEETAHEHAVQGSGAIEPFMEREPGAADDALPEFDVSCVVHVHTTYSDGTATVGEVLAAARALEVDAVLLTDHDSLEAKRDGWEGMHDGVFLLVGSEISPKHGHYLAFGIDTEISHRGRSAAGIAAAVRAAGGVGFAAHPFSTGGRMILAPMARQIVRPHGWPALDGEGCDGIELWSLTTDAAESWRTPAQAIRWLHAPETAVALGPPEHYLRRWDALSAQRRVPAIGGLDGHAPGLRWHGKVRSPLSHARTFGLLRTHLLCSAPLTGERHRDGETIERALVVGSAWLTCPFVAPAHGARLWAERPDGATIPMGGEAPAGPAVLRVRLPQAADLMVLRDGVPLRHARTAALDLDLGAPGVYRLEARIEGRLWLLSNPVHLRGVP